MFQSIQMIHINLVENWQIIYNEKKPYTLRASIQ